MGARALRVGRWRDPRLVNVLLLGLPLGEWAELSGRPAWAFAGSALSLIPLAYHVGIATEALALRLGHSAGSVVMATLSNSVELLIGLFALQKGLTGVVQAAITGSILANILLVLGTAMLVGGVRYRTQEFGGKAANVQATVLFLAVVALVLPTFATLLIHDKPLDANRMSLWLSGGLIVTYFLGLVFTLRTHRHLFEPGEDTARSIVHGPRRVRPEEPAAHGGAASWSVRRALATLAVATALAGLAAELLTESVRPAAETFGWTDLFVGAIVVAIVANAAEHWSAVSLAWKDRMNASLQVATASSIQIALFVAPLLVFVSQAFSRPLSLAFPPLEVVAIGASVLVLNLVTYDAESNWYEGALLVMVYLTLAVAFYSLP